MITDRMHIFKRFLIGLLLLCTYSLNANCAVTRELVYKHYKYDNLFYNLYSDGTATLVSRYNTESRTEIVIPRAIVHGNKEYLIETIGEYVFANQQTLQKVYLPYIKNISQSAFASCYALHDVYLGQNVENIESGAFYGNSKMRVFLYAKNPPTITSSIFAFDIHKKEDYELYVRFSSYEKYKACSKLTDQCVLDTLKSSFFWIKTYPPEFWFTKSAKLEYSSATMNINTTRQLQVSNIVESKNQCDRTVEWISSNNNVATVDQNGNVTAVGVGTCYIGITTSDKGNARTIEEYMMWNNRKESMLDSCKIVVENKTPLTLHVNDVARVYGDENPEFTVVTSEGEILDNESNGISFSTSANKTSSVGTYEIKASIGKQSPLNDYYLTFVPGKLTIEKAPLTISAGNYTMKQGAAMPKFKADYDGFKNGEDESVLTKKPVFATDATAESTLGEYSVTVSGAEAENYEIMYEQGSLKITDPRQTITWDKNIEAKTGTKYTIVATASSGLPVTYSYACPMSAWKTPIINGNEVTFPSVGKYMIVITQSGNDEYNAVSDTLEVCALDSDEGLMYIDGIYYKYADNEHTTLKVVRGYKTYKGNVVVPKTVNGLPIVGIDDYALYACYFLNSVTIGDNVMSFGPECFGANPNLKSVTLPYNATSLYNYLFNCDDKLAEIHCRANAPYDATEANTFNGYVDYSTCVLYVPRGTKEAYAAHELWGKFANIVEEDVVMTAVVKAKSCTRVYGEDNPTFEYEVEGAALDGTPEITCVADKTSAVGTYTIEVKQGSVKNYKVSGESGTLTVTKAPLTISAGDYTKKQGDAMPAFKASYDGFKNNEDESVLTKKPTFTCEATEASAPAEYAVTVSGAEAQNYDISYVPGKLTVVQADAVIIRAKSCTRTYGDDNPTFEYEVEGAALDGIPEITCVADKTSAVGTYAIEVKQGTVKNYNVTYTAATLTVAKAPLTISAGDYTKKQGDAMPEFKASYAGFKNNEDESVLTKKPTFTCEATEASAPAEYAVTVSGAEAQNYDISYVPGKLTVVQADAVIIRAKSCTRTYGDDNPTFEYEVEGAALDGIPEITCVADKTSAVGTYAIEVKQGTVKNYNVTYTAATLTVTKAPLTISAGNYTKKQGDAMPEFKASYAGFKNNEDESVLTKKPTFTCEATEASAPGEYAVTVSGAAAQNYEISYVPGKLTVVQADAVIIRAKSCTRTYGDDNPTFEYEVEGAALDGIPEITCVADKTSAVGTYAIEVKQGTVKNYNVTYTAATLTVTKAPLTISAGNYTKKQGDAMPEFKASYAGFKNNEDESVLTKKPTFTCEATEASAPGEYAVVVSGAEAQNYEISYMQGTLKILDSRQTITWKKDIEPKTGTTYTMDAVASSGLPVTYSHAWPMSAWQTPEINGSEIIFPTEGRYMIIATQEGNDEYDAVRDTLEVCALESDEGLMYIDGIYYKYADDEHKTLKVVRGYKTYKGNVVIPETVNGLLVVEIDNRALYACYFLDSVTVGDNVTKFGAECLGADPNLKYVTLPYKATSLPNYLFNCDDKLAEIHCRANTPYDANENLFNGFVDYSTCVLYVPRGTKEAYAAHELWGKFANIEEEDVETGILQIENTVNANDAWYTINGMKLQDKPKAKGIYIHNGKKIFVR